jgi:hypothetical protein
MFGPAFMPGKMATLLRVFRFAAAEGGGETKNKKPGIRTLFQPVLKHGPISAYGEERP